MGLLDKILTNCGLSGIRHYFGGNSGYVGYSKSKRAVAAENNGLRNKSQMDASFRDQVNELIVESGGTPVTLTAIKKAADSVVADEWHHTSMYGNKTNYYSPATIAIYFCPAVLELALEKEGQRHAETRRRLLDLREQRQSRETNNALYADALRSFFGGDSIELSTPYQNLTVSARILPYAPQKTQPLLVERVDDTYGYHTRPVDRDSTRAINKYPLALPIYDKLKKQIEDVIKSL